MSVPPAGQPNPFPLYRHIDIPHPRFNVSKDGFAIPFTRKQVALYEAALDLKRRALKAYIQTPEKEANLKHLLGQPQGDCKTPKSVDEMTAREVELMYKMLEFRIRDESHLICDEIIP